MRSSDRVLELRKRIVDYHGKISDITIYNKDPYPARKADLMKQNKPRVPPFKMIKELKGLRDELQIKEDKEEKKRKNEMAKKEGGITIDEDPEPEEIKDPYHTG